MAKLSFNLEHSDHNARAGRLVFGSGSSALEVETPVFMPVGTAGTVKAINQRELQEIGFRLILGNTYHLYLRPGTAVLDHFGGLKKFMSWPGAILTDSGGYQAFSLSSLTKYHDHGVEFRSHIDGSSHMFTPQKVLDIQHSLGSDIVMPIDDCAPYPAEEKRLRQSLERTHRWLAESAAYMQQSGYASEQNLFSIVQGGTSIKLREESARFAASLDLPGNAIGGLSVGEKGDEFLQALQASCQLLPANKPRYLMGVGSIPEIINAVALGVDMMDCVLPTRNARNGQVFSSKGKVNLRAEYNRLATGPIDDQCNCMVCQNYSLGYIRHLHKAKEILALTLSTYHNLYFMFHFMKNLRQSIVENRFESFRRYWLDIYAAEKSPGCSR